MGEPFPEFKSDPWGIYTQALAEHQPSHVFALFSGGNDSTVLVSWAKQNLGDRLDAAVFIDTGTARDVIRDEVRAALTAAWDRALERLADGNTTTEEPSPHGNMSAVSAAERLQGSRVHRMPDGKGA